MRQDQVSIQTPCDVEWNSLERRATGRFCQHCQKLVHDLSSLTEAQARGVLAGATQAVCVRYLYDATGEIQFAGVPPLVPASRLSRTRRGVAVALSVAPLLMQACGGAGLDPAWSDNCDDLTGQVPPSASGAMPVATVETDAGVPLEPAPSQAAPCEAAYAARGEPTGSDSGSLGDSDAPAANTAEASEQ